MSETSGADKPAHEEPNPASSEKNADETHSETLGEEGGGGDVHAGGEEAPKHTEGGGGTPDRRVAKILAVLVLLGLPALLFLLSGPEKGKSSRMAKYGVGKELDVEITLVPTDKTVLACASKETINGRHCAFENSTTPWKGGPGDDKTQIKPYNTVEQEPLMISGLWSEPALSGQLPSQRFSVKCHFKVDGKLSKPQVKWQPSGPWIDEQIDWPVGTVSRCALVMPKPLLRGGLGAAQGGRRGCGARSSRAPQGPSALMSSTAPFGSPWPNQST